MEGDLHLFGYGSLLFKAPFPYASWQPCVVRGFRRVFYQGSTDHRGTVERPGRVVTIEDAAPEAECAGVLFIIPAAHREEVLTALDIREKGGYEQRWVQCHHPERADEVVSPAALCYIALPSNEEYAGPASEEAIAHHVSTCHGPSGPNSEYVIKLAECLRLLRVNDDHVYAIEAALKAIMGITEELSLIQTFPLDADKRQ